MPQLLIGTNAAVKTGMDNSVGADLRQRSFRFACAVAVLSLDARRPGAYPLLDQLLKASSSVGANLEEAKAASSRREFIRMCEISLREARESVYWLRIGLAVGVLPPGAEDLRKEGEELSKIIAVIVINSKRRLRARAVTTGAMLLVAAGTVLNFAF